MRLAKKAAIIALVVGLGAFGYSQYASASQIGVAITESRMTGEAEGETFYDMKFEFDNPSLLMLTAGQTEFTLTADGERIGDGTLEPFVLQALDKTTVDGTFIISESGSEQTGQVRISGITKYDVLFASLDVPFVYYPTDDQARAFIHQG